MISTAQHERYSSIIDVDVNLPGYLLKIKAQKSRIITIATPKITCQSLIVTAAQASGLVPRGVSEPADD
jgi:hypothetical protein